MPEIVEVEKLRRQLQPWVGHRAVAITTPAYNRVNPRKFADDWSAFRSLLLHERITDVQRRGKFLWVIFETKSLLVHLSSTGWFLPRSRDLFVDPIHENFMHSTDRKGTRLTIWLDDGEKWDYIDPRTWGTFRVRDTIDPDQDPSTQRLGPDWLLQPEEASAVLLRVRTNRTAKDVLTDQQLTAGVGNYLAVEALYRARVHPHQRWSQVGPAARTRTTKAIRRVLDLSMERSDHKHWHAFKRRGKPCRRCKTSTIEYAKDGNSSRGSYFCPICQVPP